MSIIVTGMPEYYFAYGQIYIIADRPDTEGLKRKHPDLPVATLKELEAVQTEDEAKALFSRKRSNCYD